MKSHSMLVLDEMVSDLNLGVRNYAGPIVTSLFGRGE